MKLSQGIYNFSNIRYAAPPLGDLRFRAPVPPQVNRSEIQDGTIGRVCPQATPLWESIATTFVETQLLGLPYTGPLDINASSYPVTPQDPRTTEDCLFLDVVVPQRLFHKAQNGSHYEKAPVLVWIFGGGYTSGDKSAHDPSGLIRRSKEGGKDGIVYVALNYRVSLSISKKGPELADLHWIVGSLRLPRRRQHQGERHGQRSIARPTTGSRMGVQIYPSLWR